MSEGVCPPRNSSWSFLHCPEEDECANGHHHCNSTQDCHDLAEGYHCTCKQGYILSRYRYWSQCICPESVKLLQACLYEAKEPFLPPVCSVSPASASQCVHRAASMGRACPQGSASATSGLSATTARLSAAATNTATALALTTPMFAWSATTTPL